MIFRLAITPSLIVLMICSLLSAQEPLALTLRYQTPVFESVDNPDQTVQHAFHRLTRQDNWSPTRTAVIVCDMWDSHHCVNAVRRVHELVPRMDSFLNTMRAQGAKIIHAPSSCMAAYENTPARIRAQTVPATEQYPTDINSWCDQIPSEELAAYPIDQSQGGEDDDPLEHQLWASQLASMGRNPRSPWVRQAEGLTIDHELDFISDNGSEIWNILTQYQLDNVMLVGVHTNMCVLGRPFGLRRLREAGKNVVLVRDLTDTMYDPQAWPYVDHFTGTDLVVAHIERFVCPTIASNQVLGGTEFRFSNDRRIRLAIIMAEDEYRTEQSLPIFAAKHLGRGFSVTYFYGSESDRSSIPGMEQIDDANALLVSVRRRPLPKSDLDLIRNFVAKGKPVLGIRTASHAFALRNQEPAAGLDVWPLFDSQVFGGNYTNHYGNNLKSTLSLPGSAHHPLLDAARHLDQISPGGSLYKTSPLAAGNRVLLLGTVEGQPAEPVAWTFVRADGGRSFYTSLGHVDDFAKPEFENFLANAIRWSCGQELCSLESTITQNQMHASGKGKQR
ncbi:MAG: ThuA domain-containing protein [Planctomycetales bacterium]|nr:ThuA domain-containing protein [Planctomycetales bacterium]